MAGPIQDIIARYQADMRAIDREATGRLIESYRRVYDDIRAKVESLAGRALGEGPEAVLTATQLRNLSEYKDMMATIQREMQRYGAVVDDVVGAAQEKAVNSGAAAARQMILELFPEAARGSIVGVLQRMPREAVIALVGALREDSPLASITLARWGDKAAKQIGEQLVKGLVTGIGSRKTAREILKALDPALGMPLSKALTIARTETNRAFRSATRETYRRNPHVVKGWIWYANIDGEPEPCLACLAMHGTKHDMDETLDDHPNGRCTMLAITPSFEELGIEGVDEPDRTVETGEEWFNRQPEERQREMMGEQRYELWKQGNLDFEDMATTHHSDEWGDSIGVRPI